MTIGQLKRDLDALMDRFVKDNKAKLVDSRQVSFGPHECLDYRIQYTQDGKPLESRRTTFVVADRQYLLALETLAADASAQWPTFERLIASFDAPAPGAKGERLERAVAASGHTDGYDPQDPRSVFKKGTTEVQVVFAISKAKAGSRLKGQWVAEKADGYSAGEKLLEREIAMGDGTTRGYFSLSSGSGIPSGVYVLELRLDGVLLRKVRLTVGP